MDFLSTNSCGQIIVTVSAVEDNQVKLTSPDGITIFWPRHHNGLKNSIAIGDTLTLELKKTLSKQISEIDTADDQEEKNNQMRKMLEELIN